MASTQTTAIDPAIIERNLGALHPLDPSLADTLKQMGLSRAADPQPATTRDGRAGFRVLTSDAGRAWFGRSSVPGVRAEALLRQFDPGVGNVLLPGIGEGTEVHLLLERLGPHRAVFVWEPQPVNVRLALELHEFAAAIVNQRLVLMCCPMEDLSGVLLQWLIAHPGHLCPERILMWPWQSSSEAAQFRNAVQSTYSRIETHRAAQMAAARSGVESALASRRQYGPAERPCLALLATRVSDEQSAWTDAMLRGAEALNWRAIDLTLRTPADCHPLARITRLTADPGSGLALLLDGVRHEFQEVIPAAMPVASWLGSGARLYTDLPEKVGPHDAILVTSSRQKNRLAYLGIPPARIGLLPFPCITVSAEAAQDEPADHDTHQRPVDVVLSADLAPVDPAAYGQRLESLVRIWKIAVDLLKARIEHYQYHQAGEILRMAEATAGATVADPQVREYILDCLGHAVANTLSWQFIRQTLKNAGVVAAVQGRGWSDDGIPSLSPPQREALWRSAKIAVFADVSGEVPADLLSAASCGAVVLWRAHQVDNQPAGLATLLKPDEECIRFSTAGQMLAGLLRLLGNAKEREGMARRAVARCLADHVPSARLAALQAGVTSCFRAGSPLA